MNLSNALMVPSKAAACSPALPGCNAAYPQRPPHGFLLRNVEKGIVKGENLFVRLEHESSSRRSVLHMFWRLWQQRLHGWCNTCQAHRGLPPENRQVSGVTAVPSYHIYRERGRVLYIYIYPRRNSLQSSTVRQLPHRRAFVQYISVSHLWIGCRLS